MFLIGSDPDVPNATDVPNGNFGVRPRFSWEFCNRILGSDPDVPNRSEWNFGDEENFGGVLGILGSDPDVPNRNFGVRPRCS